MGVCSRINSSRPTSDRCRRPVLAPHSALSRSAVPFLESPPAKHYMQLKIARRRAYAKHYQSAVKSAGMTGDSDTFTKILISDAVKTYNQTPTREFDSEVHTYLYKNGPPESDPSVIRVRFVLPRLFF